MFTKVFHTFTALHKLLPLYFLRQTFDNKYKNILIQLIKITFKYFNGRPFIPKARLGENRATYYAWIHSQSNSPKHIQENIFLCTFIYDLPNPGWYRQLHVYYLALFSIFAVLFGSSNALIRLEYCLIRWLQVVNILIILLL